MKIYRQMIILCVALMTCGLSQATSVDMNGAVNLNGCSGALVRFSSSKKSDQALILSAGHCAPWTPEPFDYIIHKKYQAVVTFLKSDGTDHLQKAKTSELIYATMTDTDVALFGLNETYQEIEDRIGSKALLISEKPAKAADYIVILSGQLHKSYSCQIEALVYNLIEGDYVWQDSLRYARPGCEVVGGTSGSPILNQATGEIIGLNNTGNQGGKMCSDGSPCEVSKNGSVYAEVGFNYGQQVYSLATCFVRGQFNLNFPGCESFH